MLSRNCAVITGKAALAFIMRDRALLTDELEICVSCLYAKDLIQEFEANNYVKHTWSEDMWPTFHPN